LCPRRARKVAPKGAQRCLRAPPPRGLIWDAGGRGGRDPRAINSSGYGGSASYPWRRAGKYPSENEFTLRTRRPTSAVPKIAGRRDIMGTQRTPGIRKKEIFPFQSAGPLPPLLLLLLGI